jgi:acyl transferase domain-containing protein/acyl carrier protein/SAM-dependent methyltransferase/NADP-dependent 3-hydroxy acid dehydrogenase YdfG
MKNGSFDHNEPGILNKIEEEIARLLNQSAESLDFQASFLELGIDSQMGVDLVEGLSKKLGIRLGPEVIFDYRGPVELAQHIAAAYRDHFEAPEAGETLKVPAALAEIKTGDTGSKDIAIIGISGKFADSEDVEEYWQHLEKGDCCIKEINRHGWHEAVYYDPNPAKDNKSVSKWGGFLKRIDTFDPLFFSISPREAQRMDPQQRLFLEESIKAFEDSGYSPGALAGQKIGVFVGCRGMDYQEQALLTRDIDSQLFLGNDMAILSGRVSYHLNLKGPNITIDAACSSSLAAIHLACESILQGESELALAGGVFLLPSPQFYIMASKAEMLSPQGKCRTFNEEADGMVVGEGVGALVLKPLKKAGEDNDHIYGIIKGSGMNHNGRTQGITAPSTIPQKELITRVCRQANINPGTVTYIEIQGTGSALGDPIEFKALTEAFAGFTDKKQFCAIGSHTPNMGHAMNAAGMAAVFKILLAMRHKTIPPFIGLDKINKNIHFQGSPFYINTTAQPWESTNDRHLRAGVGTFAFNGSNCYLIIEEPPKPDARDTGIKCPAPGKPHYLIPLSAKTQASLQQKLADLAAWLDKEKENPSPFLSIENIAYTLQVGRSHFPFRCTSIVKDIRDLGKKIGEILERGSTTDYVDNLLEPRDQGKEKWTSSQKYLFKEVARKLIDEMQESGSLSENSIKEKLLALADLYVTGYDLDWEALYRHEKGAYYRLSMPAYPFAREQHWMGGGYRYDRNQQKPEEAGEGKEKPPSILEIAIDRKTQPLMDSEAAARVEKGLEEVQTLAHHLVLKVFQRMGVFQQGGEKYHKEPLKQQLKILPLYSRLFEGLLDILARAGFIRITAGPDKGDLEINTTPKLEDPLLKKELDKENLEDKVKRLLENYPEIQPYTRLLWVTHQEYTGILKGDIPATDVMFPHYSMELMEGIYRGNYTADYYNRLTAWAVVSYIRTQLPMLAGSEKIKMLEIGAGTGGTSAVLFEAIRPYADRLVYVYTDISAGFTRYGKKQYEAKNPFVVFKVLDIEKEITGQGYEPGDFDILIATNVLHATRSIPQILAKAGILLKKNGWLIANELTGVLDIYTINFGLLEGWWVYEDESNRLPDSPLLSPGTWQNLLRQEGFGNVLLLGHPDPKAPDEKCISQHVIIGEYSGPGEAAATSPKPVCPGRQSNINTEKGELHQQVEDQILDILAEILEINKNRLDPGTPHTDYGVDSLLSIEIIERINQELGIHLKSTDLFNYPTVKRLTGYILETCGNLLNLPGRPGNGREQVGARLLGILSSYLHIDQKELDPDTPFADLGMDAVTANGVVNHLNEELGTTLTASDLINHIDAGHLTDYIVNRWGDLLKESPAEAGEDLFTHRDKPGEVNAPYRPGPGLLEIASEEPRGDIMGSMAIAVIGMAARCPGARDIDEFWHNLTEGKDSIREVTRWEIDSFFDPAPQIPGKCNCKWGGFLSDIDAFDPLFFNISPKEAELMDPQHRLFLEEAWKALEDAGYPDKDLEETRCGVFVGFNLADYQRLLEKKGLLTEAYTFTGNHEAILSARLSYFLDLKGPGITINTACSTSLVAVHLACESIRCGTSDIAIAGGAQVMNTPELYIKTGRAGMLSPEGKCKTFDNSADGFVPGEGVGVVVLKPLQIALQDKDHIYGVIIGSGINQDGKTSGITAPSAPSQTQLECQVYDRYNIDPRTITYIEAHGTGTRLGDPIEVDALTTAFKKYTPGKQFCAIGSVKTNIGHTGAAAGVTGLIKTLLCLKNKQLVPSIHFQKENEFINFKDSPFYVNTQPKEWQSGEGIPRTAAVSSFGFSGTNAHVVLSEPSEGTGGLAPLPGEQLSKIPPYYMIPISAKTSTVLEQKLKDMITWLENHGKDSQLKDISYTLLVGRSHFSHRSVLLVKSGDGTAQLVEHLRTILEEDKSSSRKGAVWENYLTGTRENPHFKPSPALQQFGEALIRELQEYTHINPSLVDSEYKRKLLAVADLYSKGYDLEWKNLYRAGNCRRISLPTYPFETVRCWVPDTPGTLADRESGTNGRGSHPLIDRVNLEQSLNRGVVFQKTLEANDFILEHHQVQGRSILPGVGHLEMALAAVSRLKGIPVDAVEGLRLKRVTWLQPLEVSQQEGKKDIFIVVDKSEGNGPAFTYEIKSHNQGRPLPYSRGEIDVDLLSPGQPQERQRLSLEDIKTRCTQHLDANTFYSRFAAVGITYGPYFKGVVQAWGNEQEALGELSLPPEFERERPRCILHPCLADGALQTIMAVTHLHNPMRQHTIVPFYVEEVEILHPQAIKTHGYSYVRAAGPNRFHVALLDEKGTVCIKFHELAVRELKTAAPVTDTREISFYIPGWKPQPLPGGENKRFASVLILYPPFSSSSSASPGDPLGAEFKNALAKAHGNTRVKEVELETGNTSNLRECLRQLHPDEVPLVYFLGGLPMGDGDNFNGLDLEVLEQSQELGVMSLFRLVKMLSGIGYSRQPLTLKVITSDVHRLHPAKPGSHGSIKPYAASLHGLVRSMVKEFPSWETGCIDISLEEMKSKPGRWEHLVRQVIEEPASVEGSEVVIRGGKRYVRTLTPVKFPPLNQENQEKYSTLEPFKSRGVYCILGGTGGIGLELGLFLARTVQARLVLMDRNPVDRLTPGQKEKIAHIETSGGQVLVISVNAADPGSMAAAVKKTNAHFGRVNGVFHSAIVLKDRLLENMEETDFRAVLAPKVRGSVVLYRVFREQNLDFIMFFSSAQSFIGNPGQANYAAGCTFKDAFAHYLSQQIPCMVRVVNWGYWGSVGIVASEEYKHLLAAQGMHSIQPTEGIAAVRQILSHGINQVIAIKAEVPLLEKMGVDLNHTQQRYPHSLPSLLQETVAAVKAAQFQEKNAQAAGFQQTYGKTVSLGRYLLLHAFREMGVFHRSGERYDAGELKQQLGIVPAYTRLFTALLAIQEKAGFISIHGQEVITLETLDDPQLNARVDIRALEQEKHRSIKEAPAAEPHINLLWACLTVYPQVLTGCKNHMEVMFPGGSRALVEGIYKENPSIDFYNRLVTGVVKQYIEQRFRENSHEPLNILEVGAGTGGTSAFVLEEIKSYHQKLNYYYTDISAGFTRYGKEKYGNTYPFTKFQVLDIEKDPNRQGFEPGSMDLVLSSNVLHATRCMDNTLEQCKRLLETNGVLVINEITQPWDFATLTFGLTDGWWYFEDEENRWENSPLLGPGRWQEVLAANGFKNIHILGIPGLEAREMEQAVIVAESDGWVTGLTTAPPAQASTAAAVRQPTRPIATTARFLDPVSQGNLRERTLDYIKGVFCKVLKIENTRMDPRATFENYGVDSLVTLDINREFARTFKKLSTTLLFEYTTMEALADYFIRSHRQELEQAVGHTEAPEADKSIIKEVESQETGTPGPYMEDIFKSSTAGTVEIARAATDTREIPVQDANRGDRADIAIIGVSGRYPQAPTLEDFWENLEHGRDCITEIPLDRWKWDENMEITAGMRWGGFIQDVDKFDPLFFNISPAEAREMDPQERLFLEIVWELLEDAGITRKNLEEMNRQGQKVGVFVGVMNRDYEWCGGFSPYSSIANRVSYFFNLQGPSLAVDTSCSASLTAVHLACQGIKRGECSAAIAGGVNLVLHPGHYDILAAKNMLSGGGRCKSFGDGADGFVVGEGVGAILLKSLDSAQAAGDHIYARIKATAVNAGGKTGGYMVPNPNAQTRLVSDALAEADIDPRTIGYIEAQATGSALGDPIEITGLTKAFTPYTREKQFCAIGSVKSNIGHLESASGIAGLTKVLLQMKHKQLVPSIHAETLNPGIPFADSPFYLQRQLMEWKQAVIVENGEEKRYPRRAGVSSFGAGGANAHIILEEYEEPYLSTSLAASLPGPYLIVLSARNERQLKEYTGKLKAFLEKQLKPHDPEHDPVHDPSWLARLAYTLQEGREPMKQRLAMVVSTIDQLMEKLERFCQGGKASAVENLYQGRVETHQIPTGARSVETTDREELARLWVSGVEIPWKQLYPDRSPGRISLPTYPFERKRYWITGPETAQPLPGTYPVSTPRTDDKDRKSIENVIVETLTAVLEIPGEEFDTEAVFTDFGVDSIFAVAIINRLNEKLGLQLRATDLFNYPTIGQLTHHILAETGEELAGAGAGAAGTNPGEYREYPGFPGEESNRILEIFRKLQGGELTGSEAWDYLEMH